MNSEPTVSFDDVAAAARRLHGVAHRTPVVAAGSLDARVGARLLFKAECLQRTGSFKFRGAYNALAQLSEEQRRRGVLAFSSGNHAQAVALAGRLLGVPTLIVMPTDANPAKLAATRAYGADVRLHERAEITREELGEHLAAERGLEIVRPYDDPRVIAGQGTVALELLEDRPPLDVLLAPVGGGGLLSGCAVVAKALRPTMRVIGVEPAAADDAARSFRSGQLQTVRDPQTIADGARTPSLGQYTFPLVRQHVDEIVTVDDGAIARAMRLLWERTKLVVEPTGALPLAAVLEGAVDVEGRDVGVVLSGGNVDLGRVADYWRLADAMPVSMPTHRGR